MYYLVPVVASAAADGSQHLEAEAGSPDREHLDTGLQFCPQQGYDCHLSRRVGELGEVHQVGGGLCVGGGEDGDRAAGDQQTVDTGEYLDTGVMPTPQTFIVLQYSNICLASP